MRDIRGLPVEAAFWTGSYYKFTDAGARSTDAFVDVLWPQHVAEQLSLPNINPPAHVAAHLTNTFDLMTQEKDSTGHMLGAPNLVPYGGNLHPFMRNRPRELGFQAAVVWTGTNVELAGTLIREGRPLGRPVVHQIYSASASRRWCVRLQRPRGMERL